MKKILFFICCLAGLSVAIHGQTNSGKLNFPEDFNLKAGEAPKGFELLKIDEEARQEGLLSNPGLVNVSSFGPDMYQQADIAAMKQILLAVYRDLNPEGMDINISAIEYQSAKALEKEIPKLSAGQDLKFFLKRDQYLVIVSGDLSGSYRNAVTRISEQLMQRLRLTQITTAEKNKVEPEPEAVEVPVQKSR